MDWQLLARRLDEATGSDTGLDAEIAAAFAAPEGRYTGSVDDCRALVARALPGWRLHLGFDVTGVFPYAALTRDAVHLEAEAPNLSLAILKVAVQAVSRPPETPAPAP